MCSRDERGEAAWCRAVGWLCLSGSRAPCRSSSSQLAGRLKAVVSRRARTRSRPLSSRSAAASPVSWRRACISALESVWGCQLLPRRARTLPASPVEYNPERPRRAVARDACHPTLDLTRTEGPCGCSCAPGRPPDLSKHTDGLLGPSAEAQEDGVPAPHCPVPPAEPPEPPVSPLVRWQGTSPACVELPAWPRGWGDTGGPCHMPVGVTVPTPYPDEWPRRGKGAWSWRLTFAAPGAAPRGTTGSDTHGSRRGRCTQWGVPAHHPLGWPRMPPTSRRARLCLLQGFPCLQLQA